MTTPKATPRLTPKQKVWLEGEVRAIQGDYIAVYIEGADYTEPKGSCLFIKADKLFNPTPRYGDIIEKCREHLRDIRAAESDPKVSKRQKRFNWGAETAYEEILRLLLTALGGGLRHSLVVEHQLRPLFGFFEACTVSTAIYASATEFEAGQPLPPIIAKQAPLPVWASDLDGSRKIVLVTQGTVANHNFDLLVGPTLAALANGCNMVPVASARSGCGLLIKNPAPRGGVLPPAYSG